MAIPGLLVAAGCAGLPEAGSSDTYAGLQEAAPRTIVRSNLLTVRWMERLVPQDEGPYVPVERSSPVLDPRRNRLYVGTTQGYLYALTAGGRRLYRLRAGGAIESHPAFDPDDNELYFGTEQGRFLSVRAGDGQVRWAAEVRAPVRTSPALSEDAVYVANHDDEVIALSREDGSILWEYARSREGEGFSISEHADVTLAGRFLLGAFTDGAVIAFDAADGTVVWIRDTSTDLVTDIRDTRARFFDVDTTPVVVDDLVYAASFTGGLYALELSNGGVRWRDRARTGVTQIARDQDGMLVLASADEGIVRYDPMTQEVRWTAALERGVPSGLALTGDLVLTGSSRGPFVARDLATGRDLASFEGSAGFTAPPVVGGGLGFVLSNDGALFCFEVRPSAPLSTSIERRPSAAESAW